MTLRVEKCSSRAHELTGSSVRLFAWEMLRVGYAEALVLAALVILPTLLHFCAGKGAGWFIYYCAAACMAPAIMSSNRKARVLRSLPLDRRVAGTFLWCAVVWTVPLLTAIACLLALKFVSVGIADILFFTALVFTLSASVVLFFTIAGIRSSRAAQDRAIAGDVFSALAAALRSRRWPVLLLAAIPLITVLVHPAWRFAQSDAVHYALIALMSLSLILTFRWREHLWGDLMTERRQRGAGRGGAPRSFAFLSRRWAGLWEWNEFPIRMLLCVTVFCVAYAVRQYLQMTLGWRISDFLVILVACLPLRLSNLPFLGHSSTLRVYRMLPYSSWGLVVRLVYQYAAVAVPLLITISIFVSLAQRQDLIDVLAVCCLTAAVGLVIMGSVLFDAIWIGAGFAFLSLLFLVAAIVSSGLQVVSIVRVMAILTSASIVAGVALHYWAVAVSSGAYPSRPLQGTGEVE